MLTFHQKIAESHYTLALSFAVVNWDEIYFLCQTCRYNVTRRFSEVEDFIRERRKYVLEVNFQGRFIDTDLGLHEARTIRSTCDLNPGVYGVLHKPPTVEVYTCTLS